MARWIFKTLDGVIYIVPSEATTYEDACVDFASFLQLSPERFAEFALTLNPKACSREES